MKNYIVKLLMMFGLMNFLTLAVFAQTTASGQPNTKQQAPEYTRELPTDQNIRLSVPTVVDKAEIAQRRAPLATVKFSDNVKFDSRKFGFPNLRSFKVAVRRALGLPSGFPISVREEINYKYGKREGLLITGPSPQVINREGKPLTMMELQKRSLQNGGSVPRKRNQ